MSDTITVGELLVRALRMEGVDFMCGIVDGAHIPFVRHLDAHGIRYVNTRHEEAAAHIAEAYARPGTHRPAVVIGNPGPGGANMLAGLTSGARATGRRHRLHPPGVGQLARCGGRGRRPDLVDMARPITSYSALISRADRAPTWCAPRSALRRSVGPDRRSCHPDELLTQPVDLDSPPSPRPDATG